MLTFCPFFNLFQTILLACLPFSIGPSYTSWCIFSRYLKYTRINLMCIQFISKASIAEPYRREIFTVMSAYEHFSPSPPSPATVIIAIAGTISDSKFRNLERGSGGKITIWIEGTPLLGGIDGQIIVNKQKWVGQKLQPFLTMARIALSWEKKKKSRRAWSSTNMETSQLSARLANFVLHCCSDNNHNGQKVGRGLEIQFLPNIPSPRPQLAWTPAGIWMGF